MFDLLKRLFRRQSAPAKPVLDEHEGTHVRPHLDQSVRTHWMFPPKTVVDPAAWDQYWLDQLSHGVAEFVDIFVDDGQLVDAMRANGLRTVLCVGNGISLEPYALAWAGFDVTALDISPLAATVLRDVEPPEDFLAQLVGGRSCGQEGRMEIVVGDLSNPACCPGPYDVVIERKTLQLWPDGDRPMAVQAVVNRMAHRGIFFSQAHDGRWRPPAPRRHAVTPWFLEHGWKFWEGQSLLTERVVWPFTTTG